MKKEKLNVPPSEYVCCTEGTCPQHQEMAEVEASLQVVRHSTMPHYSDDYLMDSLGRIC
jgi:hypothetical protein